jgi:hypothetical protein
MITNIRALALAVTGTDAPTRDRGCEEYPERWTTTARALIDG